MVTTTRRQGTGVEPGPGLRERKKRQMRQQLSDTATALFLERGFDAVRVTEVAEACGVSEKTVFNYFPVKEALVMDRLEGTLAALRTGLADPAHSPVDALSAILETELRAMTGWLAGPAAPDQAPDTDTRGEAAAPDDADPAPEVTPAARATRPPSAVQARNAIRRFGDLVRATPSLRAYQADVLDRSAAVVAQVLAARLGVAADDPEPQIAARSLLGLWHVYAESLRKHLGDETTEAPSPERLHAQVTADVTRAARLLQDGLSTLLSH
jgi:AcrR family transcriptional regulator